MAVDARHQMAALARKKAELAASSKWLRGRATDVSCRDGGWRREGGGTWRSTVRLRSGLALIPNAVQEVRHLNDL